MSALPPAGGTYEVPAGVDAVRSIRGSIDRNMVGGRPECRLVFRAGQDLFLISFQGRTT